MVHFCPHFRYVQFNWRIVMTAQHSTLLASTPQLIYLQLVIASAPDLHLLQITQEVLSTVVSCMWRQHDLHAVLKQAAFWIKAQNEEPLETVNI